ncbi:MAG TPA: hypothetical protein VJ484_02295 [Lysobacter sp.]|nr:hypothetical protein [Lysobacter sp.]
MGTTIAKRLTIALLGAALVPAFAASAQVADQPTQDDAVTQDADAQAEQDQAKKPDVNDRNCLRHTGSRIPPRVDKKNGTCVNAYGNSYTREDLGRTGEINTADALRKVDVSIGPP